MWYDFIVILVVDIDILFILGFVIFYLFLNIYLLCVSLKKKNEYILYVYVIKY